MEAMDCFNNKDDGIAMEIDVLTEEAMDIDMLTEEAMDTVCQLCIKTALDNVT